VSANLAVGFTETYPVVSKFPSRYPVRKMVGVDIDDCVGDFIERFVAYANMMYGVPLHFRPTSWEWDGLGLAAGQISKIWDAIFSTPNFWLTVNPKPKDVAGRLFELVDRTNVRFITNTPETPGLSPLVQRTLWLDRIVGLRPSPRIDYGVVIAKNKGDVAAAHRLEFYVDNKPENCEDVAAKVPTCRTFLMDACHNQDYKGVIPRVANLNEFVAIVLGEKS
jgi:hypothetical protein